ncbi:MAG: type II secretion system F family protein [Acidimicrobiia bacterium]
MTLVVVVCGIGWAALAMVPFVFAGQRAAVVARVPGVTSVRRQRRFHWRGGLVGRVVGGLARRRRQRATDQRMLGELPGVLDLLGVAIGAGATPRAALDTAARWGPELTAASLRQVSVQTDLGGSFAESVGRLRETAPLLAPVAEILITSAQLGAPAGAALARLSDETRSTLHRAAEARARTLPVKLLFPLVFLVLPAFGLLTVVPAILSALQRL